MSINFTIIIFHVLLLRSLFVPIGGSRRCDVGRGLRIGSTDDNQNLGKGHQSEDGGMLLGRTVEQGDTPDC